MRCKGQSPLLAVILMVVFIAMFISYMVMSRVYGGGIVQDIKNMPNVNKTIEATKTIGYVENVWQYFMIVLVLFLILWFWAASQKKEPLAQFTPG